MVADRDEGRVNLFGNVKLFFLVFIQRTCIWLCTRCWEYWINHKEQQNTKVLPRAQSLVLEEVSQCLLYKMVKMLHWKREKYHRNTAGDANLRKSGQEGNAWAGVQRGQRGGGWLRTDGQRERRTWQMHGWHWCVQRQGISSVSLGEKPSFKWRQRQKRWRRCIQENLGEVGI